MDIRPLTPHYAVAPQIEPSDLSRLRAEGYSCVICNRPDDEQPGQPSAGSVGSAAEAAGLSFRYIPVVSGQITGANVEDMAGALEEMPAPVFAYCRSGARCTNLYALIQQSKG